MTEPRGLQIKPFTDALVVLIKMARLIIAACLLLILLACETVPQSQVDEATPLGDGQVRLEFNANSGTNFSVARGFSDSFDAGMQWDIRGYSILSFWLKRSLINQPQGWSVAALGGYFRETDDKEFSGYFLGPIASYRQNNWLFSIRGRYNWIDLNERFANQSYLYGNEEVVQLSTSVRWFFRDDFWSIKLGLGCYRGIGTLVGAQSDFATNRAEDDCEPSIGLSFYL